MLHHLDPVASAMSYDPAAAGVDPDLHLSSVPLEKVLETLDPLVAEPLELTEGEFVDLVQFLRTGLLDHRITPDRLMGLIPRELPSGFPLHEFEDVD